ncbi:hypothetical protein HY857_00865 [Candidatus Saccharibacteria bacterium]|nr:hypothetical protein [Candidatus Saccharibacteria bacterium]
MSEAQTGQLEVPNEEAFERIELDNLSILNRLGWSPITDPIDVRYQRQDVISQLKELSNAERIVPTAYYALQLAIESLQTPSRANAALNRANRRGYRAPRIRDAFLIAHAVTRELELSNETYLDHGRPLLDIDVITASYTPKNVGCLRAIRQMREVSNPNFRIPFETGVKAETVLRGFIARWAGLESQTTSPQLESVE